MKNKNKSYIRKWAKKIIAIRSLGGVCSKCGTDNIFVLQFHHVTGKKRFDICSRLTCSLRDLMPEVKKCILLCSNCHSEEGQKTTGGNRNTRRQMVKQSMLDYKNSFCCSICGYKGENSASLDLHHSDPSNKSFNVTQFTMMYGLSDIVCQEIEKCVVVCKKCHLMEHFDIERFKSLESEIYNMVENHIPRNKIDHNKVCNMYIEGNSVINIANKVGASKYGIRYILIEKGIYKPHEKRKPIQTGMCRREGCKELVFDSHKFCSVKCARASTRKVVRPSKYDLIDMLDSMSMCKIGKKYGVKGGTIKKWCNAYGISPELTQKYSKRTDLIRSAQNKQ
jgi:hypothetical protein